MSIRKVDRATLAASSAAAALMVFAAPGYAVAQNATYSFDIPPQDISSALIAYGRASRTQLVFDGKSVSNKRSRALVGEYSAEDGLTKLLEGTGLRAEFAGAGAVRVVAEADTGPQSGSAAGAGAEVEALIVTAQKREEDIQDVPIAISAFTQEDLTRSQIAGGPDLITQVPNMTFTKTNFSSYSVQLRGIGTQAISATTDPAVAVAFNNTPFIRNRFFEQEFYDLQRVEVLRGPQGTLYGRNATAGVVNIISQKPRFMAEAKLSGDVSNYHSHRLEGMVNIPLVEDKVAVRLASAWTKRDGYATNQITGNPIDGRDLWSTRVTLRVNPTDALDVNLIWEHFEEDDDRLRSGKQLCKKHIVTEVGGVETPDYFQTLPDRGQSGISSGVQATFSQGCERHSLYSPEAFQTPNGLMLPYYVPLSSLTLPTALTDPYFGNSQKPDLRVIEATIDPDYRASADIGELQISFDLTDNLTLQSETAYGVDSVYSMQDFNRFNTAEGAWSTPSRMVEQGILTPDGYFCDPQLGCSNRLVGVDISTAKARQFSQELRLASDFEGPLNFSIGGNYLRADSNDKYYIFFNSLSLAAISALAAEPVREVIPYEPGVTDNMGCMLNGYLPGDPAGVYSVVGCIYVDPNPLSEVNDLGHNYFLSINPYKLVSYAVFGEAYYNVTDALKVTAGVRWTIDKKDAPRVPSWILASNSVGYPTAEVIEQDWSEPTGRLTVDWKPDLAFTDETLLYASLAHGYKAGGANPPGYVRIFYADQLGAQDAANRSATRPKVFEAEFLDAFEVGSKNTLLDGKLTLNLAAFYYDYKDYQISEIVDRSAFNRNFDATVWGIEVEADWRVMENLKFGFKGGYEKARFADHERAIDLMDRTAGNPDWVVVRPFPTYASSCILPAYVFVAATGLRNPGGISGGSASACELAYLLGRDPVTNLEYEPDPIVGADSLLGEFADYPGFNPLDESQNHNGGEGFYKSIGGNPLPNAPDWTGTITADYTVPMFNDWLATFHTDLHWQAESYWRVFDDHEFSKLDEYFTMNLAAIFTNEERGWHIMAYVKNVTDETAITGAFLNSDDTGLTSNVFLTEPKLYGMRVTKSWTGGPLLGSFGARREGPYPWTLELGGQVQRHDAPSSHLSSSYADLFEDPIDILGSAQDEDLDWGDGREVKLTWRPGSGPLGLSAGFRYGRTNGRAKPMATNATEEICAFGGSYAAYCVDFAEDPIFGQFTRFSQENHALADVWDREEHTIVDFAVGTDFGIGSLGRSRVSAGVRHAELESLTRAGLQGVPNWVIPAAFWPTELITHSVFDIDIYADRQFAGWGPVAMWEAAYPLVSSDDWGEVDLDWSVGGGVLFGSQEVQITDDQRATEIVHTPFQLIFAGGVVPPIPTYVSPEPNLIRRSSDVTAPTASASFGLSYSVGAFKMVTGYRWERYFDAIDGGYEEHQSQDRTIDGPYLKLSMGFGR